MAGGHELSAKKAADLQPMTGGLPLTGEEGRFRAQTGVTRSIKPMRAEVAQRSEDERVQQPGLLIVISRCAQRRLFAPPRERRAA